ncbi:MAG: two-component system OmpR family sensor histidine kinase BaeS [Spirochaetes bacterium]|nr:MAG: two-component system OmpR family sensor histidine kinase BaeS [Spirochaetota bacterium]
MKLKLRLALDFFLVIAVACGVMLVSVRFLTEDLFRTYVFSGDAEKARTYADVLGSYFDSQGSWADLQSNASNPAKGLAGDRVVVADANGIIVADTSGQLLKTIHPSRHVSHGIPIMSNGVTVGTVLVNSMVDSSLSGVEERFLRTIGLALVLAAAASLSLALLLGIALSTQVTRPVIALTNAAKKVSQGELGTAVEVGGLGEISELGSMFNQMTAELKRLEEGKRQLIADSAHELRTPVALIQGTIEAMLDGVYPLDMATLKSVHEETLRLSRLIDMLRELEIIQSGKLRLQLEKIDAAEVLGKAAAMFGPAAREKKISLVVAPIDPPCHVAADPTRLNEVIYNLVSNALNHTPAEGAVLLSARRDPRRPASTLLQVEDSGSGIPEPERALVFERFYRIEKSRSAREGGRGLGLAIAKEITAAHGGVLELGDSSLGGACFSVSLASDFLPLLKVGRDRS